MIALFTCLTAFNLLCLVLCAILGYAVGGTAAGQWHQLAGIAAIMICCGVHCVVFTYFIATAKWVQHAIAVKQLDASLATPTRSFKRQAFPGALLAMMVTFAAVLFGAAAFSYGISSRWHEGAAWLAIVINALAARVEYRAIAQNASLIDEILARINTPVAAVPRSRQHDASDRLRLRA
jgi:hypothetical protein